MNHQRILKVPTSGRGTSNITEAVAQVVAESGVETGLAHVFVQHTSCSLTITENADPDVRRDLETILAASLPTAIPRTATILKDWMTWQPMRAAY
jgi:secondary thiamine-phosphate synthase enzyme